MSVFVFLPAVIFLAAIFFAGVRKNFGLEQSLLIISWFALLLVVALGWGSFGNVHQGAVVLVLAGTYACLIVLTELAVLALRPSKYRLTQFGVTTAAFSLVVAAGALFGS